jgi:hypothetical protein
VTVFLFGFNSVPEFELTIIFLVLSPFSTAFVVASFNSVLTDFAAKPIRGRGMRVGDGDDLTIGVGDRRANTGDAAFFKDGVLGVPIGEPCTEKSGEDGLEAGDDAAVLTAGCSNFAFKAVCLRVFAIVLFPVVDAASVAATIASTLRRRDSSLLVL